MKFFNLFLKRSIRIFSFLFLSLLLLFVFISSNEYELQTIPHYFTIRVQSEFATSFFNSLEKNHIYSVNPFTTSFSFNNFRTQETVKVSDFAHRFFPGDFRFDPFMQSLKNFFYQTSEKDATEYTLFYLPASKPAFFIFMQIFFATGVLKGWSIWGYSFWPFFLYSFLTFFLFFILLKKTRTMKSLVVGLFIGQMIVLFTGSFYFYFYSLMNGYFILLFAKKESLRWRQSIRYHKSYKPFETQRLICLLSVFIFPLILLMPLISFKLIWIAFFDLALLFLFMMQLKATELAPGYTGLLVTPFKLKKAKPSTQSIILHSLFLVLLLFMPIFSFIPSCKANKAVFLEKRIACDDIGDYKKIIASNLFPNLPSLYAHEIFQRNYSRGIEWKVVLQTQLSADKATDYSEKYYYNNYLLKNGQISLFKQPIILYLNDSEKEVLCRNNIFCSFLSQHKKIFIYGKSPLVYFSVLSSQYIVWFLVILFTLGAFFFFLEMNRFQNLKHKDILLKESVNHEVKNKRV